MSNQKPVVVLACTFPGCRAKLSDDAAWLPEIAAMKRANEGMRVELADFPRFVLCGKHGGEVRKAQVKVYRYKATVERELGRNQVRETETAAAKAFAAKFAPKANEQRQPQRRPPSDPRNVGGGLSKLGNLDASKRIEQLKKEKSATANGTVS